MCAIVTILEKCSTDSTLVIFQLPLPPIICFDMEQEKEIFTSIVSQSQLLSIHIEMNTSG